jgi:hypothetical protein
MKNPSNPHVKIPLSEKWLFKNKKALAAVRQGLKEAKEGRVSKIDLKKL